MLNIDELSRATGLQVKFIRRCLPILSEFLDDYITRGDKNSILYSDNAVAIFNQIKPYKDKGYSLPSIKKELAKTLSSQGDDLGDDSKLVKSDSGNHPFLSVDESKNDVFQLLDILREKDSQLGKQLSAVEILRNEKDSFQKTIHELEQQKASMETSIFLLTDGKSQEEVLKDKQKKQEYRVRVAEILKELEYLDGHVFKSNHRKKLLQELRSLQLQYV